MRFMDHAIPGSPHHHNDDVNRTGQGRGFRAQRILKLAEGALGWGATHSGTHSARLIPRGRRERPTQRRSAHSR